MRDGLVGAETLNHDGKPTAGQIAWLEHPICLQPNGDCKSGQIAFDVPIDREEKIVSYAIEFVDRTDSSKEPILVPAPGNYPPS
jgi:hypothetical protein